MSCSLPLILLDTCSVQSDYLQGLYAGIIAQELDQC